MRKYCWFMDRNVGSWIGVDRSSGLWIGARSLFLSVLLCVESDLEMNWSENESVNSFPGQGGKFWSTGMQFPKNCIFRCNQTCGKWWKWFPKIIFTQNKCTRSLSLFHLKYPTPVWYFRFFFLWYLIFD